LAVLVIVCFWFIFGAPEMGIGGSKKRPVLFGGQFFSEVMEDLCDKAMITTRK